MCKADTRTPTRIRESELIQAHLRPSIEWFAPSESEGKVIYIGFTDQKYVLMQSTVIDARACETVRWRRAQASTRASKQNLTRSSFLEKQLIIPCAALAYNYDAKQTDLHN
jgi:hypothetical protein